EWLELGQSYVLELSDYRRTIKIVRKGTTDDSYRLECYNVDYDATEIPKSLIEHVWQVLMCIKRENM
ncbi:MAG: LexA family transcriptional regulator, partial [Muribaculaceae bacterium]|nr:LexA family transcriptional regulator [Muribaculaceae bacterium]